MDQPLVAAVAVDHEVPHLDRLFDYAVPPELDAAAQPGVRVRVRLAGRLVGGIIVARSSAFGVRRRAAAALAGARHRTRAHPRDRQAHAGRRRPLGRHASRRPAAGDPAAPGHGRARARGASAPPPPAGSRPGDLGALRRRPGVSRPSRVGAATAGDVGRAARPDWPAEIAAAAQATLAGGRGVVIVVPDGRDVARVSRGAARRRSAPSSFVELTADLGPTERYRRFLRLARGQVQGRRRHPGGRVRPGSRPRAGRRSGTTVPTCTTSRTRPTPTCATCWCCGLTWQAPAR